MAITREILAAEYKDDWLARTFDDDLYTIWCALAEGYGIDRWSSPNLYDYQYGIWRQVGPNKGKVKVGVFDTPEEVVAMLKLILASEEFNDDRRGV